MATTSSQKTLQRLEALQSIVGELISPRPSEEIFALIVDRAMALMNAEAGSLYLRKTDEELVFEVAKNQVLPIDFERRVLPISDIGFASHSFRTGECLRIEDVYALPKDAPFRFDRRFDLKTGYRTRSVLVCPITSSQGDRLGVLQLINPKDPDESAFTIEDETLLRSFAAVAGASLENSRLYKNIQDLFEGFVQASVNAIESRDPATRGHSERVAILTTSLAHNVSICQDFDVRALHFNDRQIAELRYASLLHDFGKIVVKEQTLLKPEKLLSYEKAAIRNRLNTFIYSKEISLYKSLLANLKKCDCGPKEKDFSLIDSELHAFRMVIEQTWSKIIELNKPTVMDEDKTLLLQEFKQLKYLNMEQEMEHILSAEESKTLSVKRGSLTEAERQEIESHVTVTYQFLKEIPWSQKFKDLPDIAHAHHEKLDGTGYPRKLSGDSIPPQARMMTICDIFDALVASDRPYKAALPTERAIDILHYEVKAGKLDARFLRVFLESKVYENSDFCRLVGGQKKKAA